MRTSNVQRKHGVWLTFLALIMTVTLGCSGDDGVSSEFAVVSGTITFQNLVAWPDSGEVQITIFPQGVWTANGPIGPPQNGNDPVIVSRNTSQAQFDYRIEGLPEGEYSAIAIGWRHPDQTLPPERRSAVLGVFLTDEKLVSTGLMIPNTPFQGPLPATVTVQKGQIHDGLDFQADFGNIRLFFP